MRNLTYISPKAVVKDSPIHGKGLFARETINKDEIVCIKGGAIIDRKTLESMPEWFRSAEIQISNDLFIAPRTAEERDGSMIFSNHSCEPNIGVRGQIVFVAMRDIEVDEELTHDWAMTDDDDNRQECNCGVASCRRVISGKDWQQSGLQKKYRNYFSWYLEEKIRKSEPAKTNT